MNVLAIITSLGAIVGVSWVYSKVTKKDFDPKQSIIQALIVGVILGVAGRASKKVSGDKGLAAIPEKISK